MTFSPSENHPPADQRTAGPLADVTPLLAQVPAAIAMLEGPHHVYTFANSLYQTLCNRTEEELLGRALRDVFPELEGQGVYELFDGVYATGQPFTAERFEARLERDDALQTTWYDFTLQPVKRNEAVVGVMVFGSNATPQVEAGRKADESEQRFRRLFEASPNAISEEDHTPFYETMCRLREQGVTDYGAYFAQRPNEFYDTVRRVRVKAVNPALLRLTGTRNQAEFEANRTRLFVNATEQSVIRMLELLRDGGGAFYEETTIQTVQGETRRVWIGLTYPSAPPYTSIPVTLTDTTGQAVAETAAEESEHRFRTLINQADVATAVYAGREMRVDYANEAMLRIWGKDPSVIGKTLREALPELEGQPFHDLLADVYTTGKTYWGKEDRADLEIDGHLQTGYFNFTYKPLRNREGQVYGILNMAVDVTPQVTARKALEESENRFRMLANDASAFMFLADADANVVFVNRRWREFVGLGADENIGQSWSAVTHPDDVQLSYDLYAEAVRSLKPYQLKARQRRADGQWRWIQWDGVARKDADGQFAGVVGVGIDITEQKQFAEELEALVAERTGELQRSNEDLQQFAHVASHDLKEPVRKVITFQDRLRHELGNSLSEKAALYLDKIAASSLRMYHMIDGVLAYSTLSATAFVPEPVALDGVFNTIETDLELLVAEKNAAIERGPLPVVAGSAVLLHQLFYNLVANALKFTKSGVAPRIRVSADEHTDEDGRRFHRIVVRDNGIGFGQNEAEHIFQTFTRLNAKDRFEGTGLGLSLCRKIAERHGGRIWAEGKPGEGSAFFVALPMLEMP